MLINSVRKPVLQGDSKANFMTRTSYNYKDLIKKNVFIKLQSSDKDS